MNNTLQRYKSLLAPSGFASAVVAEQHNNPQLSRREAFDRVNLEFKEVSGDWRYATYESFVQMLNRRRRRRTQGRI